MKKEETKGLGSAQLDPNQNRKITKVSDSSLQEDYSDQEEYEPLKFFSIRDLLSQQFPKGQWIIEKLVPLEGITIISGAPASCKTWITLQMALEIAKGGKLFGEFECAATGVLIIDEENHPRILQERLLLMDKDSYDLPIFFISLAGFNPNDEDQLQDIYEKCEENGIGVIIIDSLVRIVDGNENESWVISQLFSSLRRLCPEGLTIIITHHDRKEGHIRTSAQNRLRGSSDISAAVDSHIAITRDKNDKSKIKIEHAKLRSYGEELPSFEARMNKGEDKISFEYLGEVDEKKDRNSLVKEVVMDILKGQEEGSSRKILLQEVNKVEQIGESSFRKLVDNLIRENLVIERKGKKNEKIIFLSNQSKQ